MDSDVTSTLSELERKLKELERELETVGRAGEVDADPAQAGWSPPPAPAGAQPMGDPGPPPVGTTPFTASWHGGQAQAAPPPPPPAPAPAPSGFDGGFAVPVPPPQPQAPTPQPAPAPTAATAGALHGRLDELVRFRERLVQATDELVSELSRVLSDLGAAPPADPAATVFSGPVVVEAAPFRDLASLAAFEQALQRTPGVREVYVRVLDAGRASIDVELGEPVALGAALRHAAPLPFQVLEAVPGRLVLSIGPAPPA